MMLIPSAGVNPHRADSTPITRTEAVPIGTRDRPHFVVLCLLCGDVTSCESGGAIQEALYPQAVLYQQRHLAKHLTALAAEIADAAR